MPLVDALHTISDLVFQYVLLRDKQSYFPPFKGRESKVQGDETTCLRLEMNCPTITYVTGL